MLEEKVSGKEGGDKPSTPQVPVEYESILRQHGASSENLAYISSRIKQSDFLFAARVCAAVRDRPNPVYAMVLNHKEREELRVQYAGEISIYDVLLVHATTGDKQRNTGLNKQEHDLEAVKASETYIELERERQVLSNVKDDVGEPYTTPRFMSIEQQERLVDLNIRLSWFKLNSCLQIFYMAEKYLELTNTEWDM